MDNLIYYKIMQPILNTSNDQQMVYLEHHRGVYGDGYTNLTLASTSGK